MRLILREREIATVERCAEVLLSPLAHPDIRSWCLTATRAVRRLVDGDMASIFTPTPAGSAMLSDEVLPSVAGDYPAYKRRLDLRYGFPQRELAMKVWSRPMLWRPWLREMYQGDYFNDLVRPTRAFDAIAMTAAVGAGTQTAALYCHHERPDGPRFGSRGLALLRLVYPAFQAGVRAAHQAFVETPHALGILDLVDVPVMVLACTGRVLHRTPAAARLVPRSAEALVLAAAVRLARSFAIAPERPVPVRLGATRCEEHVAGLRLTATLVPAGSVSPQPIVLVQMARVSAVADGGLAAHGLRERYRLTAREAEVARGIADGLTTREIAVRLGLSAHTVRRHSERVFVKLGVHSRAAVAACVARGGAAAS